MLGALDAAEERVNELTRICEVQHLDAEYAQYASEVARSQKDHIGCAVDTLNRADPDIQLPYLEKVRNDTEAAVANLTEQQKGIADTAACLRVGADQQRNSAASHAQVLCDKEKQLQAVQLQGAFDAEARAAAARISATSVRNIIEQTARSEAATIKTAALQAAATAAASKATNAELDLRAAVTTAANLNALQQALQQHKRVWSPGGMASLAGHLKRQQQVCDCR